MHTNVRGDQVEDGRQDMVELHRGDKGKDKASKVAKTENMGILGRGKDIKGMVQKRPHHLRGKLSLWYSVEVQNEDT